MYVNALLPASARAYLKGANHSPICGQPMAHSGKTLDERVQQNRTAIEKTLERGRDLRDQTREARERIARADAEAVQRRAAMDLASGERSTAKTIDSA